ncbi:hypothetical protein HNY73_001436 [Argiope bruennichi]|uniref:Uncharacterized protein n=1 Tax=Argiope bruennichi TaxID=94029 RepID=A0A8T0G798_ARGBR|nr:hypothetical protein HNY73_001436 [Argiope bruennichi]
MQEFLAHESERKLEHSETLVDYIYAKDALLEKVPFTIPLPDRISMMIVDNTEEKWQIALATQNYITVEELIDRATALDAIRSTKQEKKPYQFPKSQSRSFNTRDEQLLGAVCYEIKSTTAGNGVLKVVHVQHLRPYCKRDTPIIEEDDSLEEESDSAAEMQDPTDDLLGVPD